MRLFESTRNTRPILPDSFRYIRSDVPAQLSAQERQWLIDHNVLTLVDLRDASERQQKPSALENDRAFRYLLLPVTGGNTIPASPEEVAPSYIRMTDAAMTRIIAAILSADTNVLYFCNAGKDRTGVVTAILLSRLGYDREYIIADYLLSGENLREQLEIFAASDPAIDLNVITPREAYMEAFLDWYQR